MAASGTGFSYAQAAKGLAPSTQSSSAVPSSTSSEQGAKDVNTAPDLSVSEVLPDPVLEDGVGDQKQGDTEPMNVGQTSHAEPEKLANDEASQNTNLAEQSRSTPANVSTDIEQTPTSTDGQSTAETAEKLPRLDKATESGDQDKAKDTDEDWEKVSIPSVSAEKELKAAPIPVVNIWQQRREAQDAKLKDGPPQKPASNMPPPRPRVSVQTSIDEPRRRQSNRDSDRDVSITPRRVNSGGRAVPDRRDGNQVSPRSAVLSDARMTPTLRSAADTESWPTPDTNITNEERRRSSIVERSERPEIRGGGQKKWVQMPFVPTAKFETQLPPAAARRGGRPANRGREGVGRGGANAQNGSNGDRAEPGTMGPPPLPNKTSDQDRGRKNTGAQNSRASSVPSHGPRTSSNDGYARDGPRYSVPHNKTPVDNPRSSEPVLSKATITAAGDDIGAADDSRSSSRHASNQMNANKPDSEHREPYQTSQSSGANSVEAANRPYGNERQRNSYHEGSRTSIDHADRGFQPNREWARGRPDATREKSESWRGRETRPDRGRGGYRGRANHNNYNNHVSPGSYTPSLGQNGFDTSKPISPQEGRNARQASQPYAQTPSIGSGRGNPRSQSIPIAMMQGGYYSPVQGFPQAISPTDINFGQYPQQMHGGIMSAMPYADQLNSYALISMVITQLEYYFSIDNLCKDMFLRKNMDSQGFVPLAVIAGFKRIKALTDGQMAPEQLRSVCQQVRNVEFVTSEDGEDRLRSREHWRDFVLPMDERLPNAQNDGPSVRSPQAPSQPVEGGFAGSNGTLSSPNGMNGFMEPFNQAIPPMGYPSVAPFDGSGDFAADPQSVDQLRRSSATSPFTNAQSPPVHEPGRSPSSYRPNGHSVPTPSDGHGGNVFPDDKIPELKVVVRDPAFESSTNSDRSEQPLTSEAISLRGGAASPEQLNHFQSIQFGQTPSSPRLHDGEQPPYWTKDGEIGQIPTGPGFVHEDYLPLRDKALAQRQDSHLDGALRVLYAFWSSFLVEHFNLSMYEEFSTLAREDLHSGSETGKTYLIKFYDALLTSRAVMSERIASDIVALAREETGERRPLWQKLRTAWRNGATNMKTRKRLGDVLNSQEKTDLDKIN